MDLESLKQFIREMPPAMVVALMQEVAAERGPEFAEAVIVQMANTLPMTHFGVRAKDEITALPGRQTYDVHPYGRPGSSALCVVMCRDKEGKLHTLLGGKSERDDYACFLSGGYMNTRPPGVDTRGQEGLWDNSLEDLARRELGEETGLDTSGITPRFIGKPVSEYGVSESPLSQHVLHFLLFDLGQRDPLPALQEKDDLKNPRWVEVSKIDVQEVRDGAIVTRGEYTMPPLHADYIHQAIQIIRREELAALNPVPPETISHPTEFGTLAEAAHRARMEHARGGRA